MADQNPSGSQVPAGGEESGKSTVSHETFAKVLSEKKSMQAKLAEAEAYRAQAEQEKLQAEGKWKELAETNKKLADDFKAKNLTIIKNMADKTIKSQFKSVSEKLGCIDPEMAYGACNFDDLDVTEDFEFDPSKLEEKIQGLTKTKPYLFKKDFKLPNDLIPSNGPISGKSLSDMNETEILQLLKTAPNKL